MKRRTRLIMLMNSVAAIGGSCSFTVPVTRGNVNPCRKAGMGELEGLWSRQVPPRPEAGERRERGWPRPGAGQTQGGVEAFSSYLTPLSRGAAR